MRDTEGHRTAEPRWFGLPPRVAAGFAAALLAVVGAALALGYTFALRSAHGTEMSRTSATLQAMHELEAGLVVSATSLDVYLVTGDGAARMRHARAAADANAALERLQGLVVASDRQGSRLDRLGRLVRTVQAQEARLAAVRDRGDAAAAEGRRRTSAIPAALREIHDLVEGMRLTESGFLREREAAWRRARNATYVVAIVAEVVLAALVVLAARTVRSEIRRREAQEAEHARMLEVQQRLMAIVGHDLRTPLSGVTWNAALLGRSSLPAPEARLARRISASARRMERLIRDLLDYGRVHAGAEIPVAPEPADLGAICGQVVEEVHDPAHPVALEVDGDPTGVWDSDRLEQLVANLVSNAVKYGPPGRPVRVRVVGEHGGARLEVHDEGGTVPESVRAHLFEPFRRGEVVGGQDGLGLGLFIVRTLAEAHGGSVEVDSAPGRGTTFVVRLPRTARRTPAAASTRA